MKKKTSPLHALTPWLGLVVASCFAAIDATGAPAAGHAVHSDDNVWQAAVDLPSGQARRREWLPAGKGREFSLNHAALHSLLARAPKEFTPEARRGPPVLALPMPDGTFARFRMVESPIMEPELAAKFPQFKTYAGQGIDDPAATVRLAKMPGGLHAHVRSTRGIVQVRPVDGDDHQTHVSYDLRDVAGAFAPFECNSESAPAGAAPVAPEALLAAAGPEFSTAGTLPSVGSQLRIFRLAMAVTGEYTQRRGGTMEDGMAAIVNTVNRLDGIFEAEAAIRMVLVANNDLLVYTNPETDPYSYDLTMFSGRSTARGQNQANIDRVIGAASYDIGHLLDTGGGGEAFIGGICANGNKASAVSGIPSETVHDDYWVYGVLPHEMGHQFGANHSWNGLVGGCTTDQYASCCAYEPGSGSTIMSYSLNCATDSVLVTNYYADAYYHSGSFDFINSVVGGAACRVVASTGNTPPVVSAGSNFTIPARTPFMLTATGSDPDGDALTYSWEERDLGPRQALVGIGSEDNGSSPLFRSYPAIPSPSRTFPRLSDILNNTRTPGEQLPSRSRTMRFRVTSRDNRAGGGGRAASDMQVTVNGNAGPFLVTSPNAAATLSGLQTIAWEVAGTANPPIGAANVNILLSTNGGFDFPMTLASNTPNDGSETVALPDLFTAQARIKVEAAVNIFFDISNTNFTILPSSPWIIPSGTTLISEGCPPANGAVDPAETVTVGFVLENIGGAAALDLTLSLLPSDSVLSPSAAQAIEMLAGGERSTNAFTFTADPALACGATLTARLRLQGSTTVLGDVDFPLHVGSRQLTTTRFSNTNRIMHQEGAAHLYPSAILVSNLTDLATKVTVTLSNVTHPSLGNQSVLLAGPQGQAVYLTFGAWAGSANNLTLDFDDAAPISLFDLNQAVSGVYQPSVIEPALMFPMPPPAPPEPNARGLSAFIGTNPNGTWRLFVSSLVPASTQIANGWSLSITTSNTSCCHPLGLAVAHVDAPDPVVANDTLTYMTTVTNTEVVGKDGVTLSNALPEGVTFVSALPTQGTCEHSSGMVRCDLGTLPAGETASVSIAIVPTAPGLLTNTVTVTHAGGAGTPPIAASALTTVQAPRSIFVEDITVKEADAGTTNAQFLVFLSEPSDVPVTVHYTTADGTALAGDDYTATSGHVTFDPMLSVQKVTVPVVNDLLYEGPETFLLMLSDPSNAVLGSSSHGTATIVDNDSLVMVADASVTEGHLGTTNLVFNVTAINLDGKTVTVGYATSNLTASAGSDYAAVNSTVTLLPSRPAATIVVPIGGDLAAEGDETFLLTLAEPSNAKLAANQVIGAIVNDDGFPGQVDRFAWDSIPSPQYSNLLFSAALSALDAFDAPVPGFHGSVAFVGLGPAADIVLGTTTTQWVYPMQSGSQDARLQSIYLASELGGAARITALALDVVTPPGQTLSNWTLRLKHTALINYPVAAWEGVGWTLVYQTDLIVTSAGLLTFPFSTPFDYDGTNHLMVDFSFNNASGSTAGQCRYRSVAGSRSLFGQANSVWGDPLAWSGTNAPAPGFTVRIPNIRLTASPAVTIAPRSSPNFAGGVWSGELLVPAAVSSLILRAVDQDGHAGVSDSFAIEMPQDNDGDELPDPWELRYFSSLEADNGQADADPDGDGLVNRDELMAGTNPTEAASSLRVTRIEISGSEVRISFRTAPGRRYQLEHTPQLGAAEWFSLAMAVTGNGAETVLEHPGGASQGQGFYRLRLLP